MNTHFIDYLQYYYTIINNRFTNGKLDYEQQLRLKDKLMQWEYQWREGE